VDREHFDWEAGDRLAPSKERWIFGDKGIFPQGGEGASFGRRANQIKEKT